MVSHRQAGPQPPGHPCFRVRSPCLWSLAPDSVLHPWPARLSAWGEGRWAPHSPFPPSFTKQVL